MNGFQLKWLVRKIGKKSWQVRWHKKARSAIRMTLAVALVWWLHYYHRMFLLAQLKLGMSYSYPAKPAVVRGTFGFLVGSCDRRSRVTVNCSWRAAAARAKQNPRASLRDPFEEEEEGSYPKPIVTNVFATLKYFTPKYR